MASFHQKTVFHCAETCVWNVFHLVSEQYRRQVFGVDDHSSASGDTGCYRIVAATTVEFRSVSATQCCRRLHPSIFIATGPCTIQHADHANRDSIFESRPG